jgi:hypothetical protein
MQIVQDQHKTRSIEEQQLHPVATAIAEGEHRTLKRVEAHRLLDQDRQAVDASPEVDRIQVEVDVQVSAQSEHDPTLR